MPIISIAIQKGGSGKTTTAINLAASLQRLGKDVLLIDADSQCNLTQSLGIDPSQEANLCTELEKEIRGEMSDLSRAIITAKCGLKIISSSNELATLELELASVYGREKILDHLLEPIAFSYDFVFIDCSPSIGLLMVNALCASDYVIIPLQAEFLPFKTAQIFFQIIEDIKRGLNHKLCVAGLVLTKFSQGRKINSEIKESLEKEFEGKVFKSFIRTDTNLVAAQKKGVDIFTFAPNSNAAEDYETFAREFIETISKSG